MEVLSEIKAVRGRLKALRKNQRIAFVPTMGAFHEGHLSLMRAAKKDGNFVVVSLFINPLQFGEEDDFKRYPRSIPKDQGLAQKAGVDLFWTPWREELFPRGFQTTVEVPALSRLWEGALRPGHFKGVSTIVAKLLQIVRPDVLYLGQKDYQQTRVVRQMMTDLHFGTVLRVLPTVREADGLAMSSRNIRLLPGERKAAGRLYHALKLVEGRVRKGERRAEEVLADAMALIQDEPRLSLDYLALCDLDSLEPIERLRHRAILLGALRVGAVRLLDNLLLSV